MKRFGFGLFCALALVWSLPADARVSADDLARQLEQAHETQIREIDRITLVVSVVSGPAQGISTTSRFQKVEKNGRAVLELVPGQDDSLMQGAAGLGGEQLANFVRKARSIREDQHEGKPVYVVLVDDVEFLRTMGMSDGEQMPDEVMPKQATVWLDAKDLMPHQMTFVQEGPTGGEIVVDVKMLDYRAHRGLPVAHRVSMNIRGMHEMMGGSDEARQAMEQLKQLRAQMDQMPPEQRAMIEGLMAGQIAQFEQMATTGAVQMDMRVTDVRFE